ncbi:uncharacterized protein LOC124256661 [Haliotis rubra]|uniref:uncharacterized protein LOC124256661 n=1 Tax=Haliotis rubra TaxID=36100 RepID=UPI001EE552CF|nr:uncharacterized protein LOC124256661 [Haliotis rubra]
MEQTTTEIRHLQYDAGQRRPPKGRKYRALGHRLDQLQTRLQGNDCTVLAYADAAAHLLSINKLNNLEKKFIHSSNHLTFLMRCRDNHLIPKGLRLTSPVHSPASSNILNKASSLLVRETIQHHRKTKVLTLTNIIEQQHQLQNILHPENYSKMRHLQTKANQNLDARTKKTHITKFNKLRPSTSTRTSPPRKEYLKKTVINLSSKNLSEDDITVLAKGLKFSPTVRLNNDTFIANIETGLQQLAPGGNVDYLRHQTANILQTNNTQKDNLNRAERKALKRLKSDQSITIAPADKGRATIIINTEDFNKITSKILNDTSTYKELKKDPTNQLQKEHKALLKNPCDKNEIGPALHKKLTVPHPKPPYARATIKAKTEWFGIN